MPLLLGGVWLGTENSQLQSILPEPFALYALDPNGVHLCEVSTRIHRP